MIPVRLLGMGWTVPERQVTTEEVVSESLPGRDPADLVRRTGIERRRWGPAEDATAAVDWAATALGRALSQADLPAGRLRTLIYTSSVGGDRIVPSTASAVGAAVGADPDCACFDVNNACTGFLTSLDLAARLAVATDAPAAVVAVEVFHRYIAPQEPRSYLVFADGAAACVVAPARRGLLRASDFGNDGRRLEATTLHKAELTGRPEQIRFGARADEITGYAMADMALSIERVLARGGVAADQVDWFFPHQPNGSMFDAFVERFAGPRARTRKVADQLGSLGCASIPVALAQAWGEGLVEDGQHLLMAAVGAGSSRGAVLMTVER